MMSIICIDHFRSENMIQYYSSALDYFGVKSISVSAADASIAGMKKLLEA